MDPKLPIRSIDYTVIFARQMSKMREFYGSTLGFPLHRELSAKWVEYRVGSIFWLLAGPGTDYAVPWPRVGVLPLQLAFRVPRQEVASGPAPLAEQAVPFVPPPTAQPFGPRPRFSRAPAGTLLKST